LSRALYKGVFLLVKPFGVGLTWLLSIWLFCEILSAEFGQKQLRHRMKGFTLCVILVTLLCFFLSTLETEGQLSFTPGWPNGKPGRSLEQVSTELFQSAGVKFRNERCNFVSFLVRGGGGGGGGGTPTPPPPLPPQTN